MSNPTGLLQFPPVPPQLTSDPILFRWLQDLVRLVNGDGSGVSAIDLSSHSLAELGTRNHSDLQNILPVDLTSTDTTRDKHVSDDDLTGLTSSVTTVQTTVSSLSSTVSSLSSSVSTLITAVANLETRSVIRNGAGAPASGLGDNGDLYIDNTATSAGANPRFYAKVAGTWKTIV